MRLGSCALLLLYDTELCQLKAASEKPKSGIKGPAPKEAAADFRARLIRGLGFAVAAPATPTLQAAAPAPRRVPPSRQSNHECACEARQETATGFLPELAQPRAL
jgi:hypothetical protein